MSDTVDFSYLLSLLVKGDSATEVTFGPWLDSEGLPEWTRGYRITVKYPNREPKWVQFMGQPEAKHLAHVLAVIAENG
jgi:hypothetical protein